MAESSFAIYKMFPNKKESIPYSMRPVVYDHPTMKDIKAAQTLYNMFGAKAQLRAINDNLVVLSDAKIDWLKADIQDPAFPAFRQAVLENITTNENFLKTALEKTNAYHKAMVEEIRRLIS